MSGEQLLSEREHANLNQFASVVWGNSQALLKQFNGSTNAEFIDLRGYFPAFQHLFAGALMYDRILVRDEYRIALEALQTKTYYLGAYVIGQPGIGKTHFLLYLLVACLGQQQAVALQLLDGSPFYALFNNSVTIHSLNNTIPLSKCPFVWALSDSNSHVKQPSGIFLGNPDRIHVVQTTLPKVQCWKWSKQVGAKCYVMDIWSKEELADLAMLLWEAGVLSKQDVEHMATLAKKLGGVPQTLLQCVHQHDQQIERQYCDSAKEAARKCQVMMCAAVLHDIPDEAPSGFYFLRPLMTSKGISRRESSMTVPTPMLCHLLEEALEGQEVLWYKSFINV